jgi:hypothetical protein
MKPCRASFQDADGIEHAIALEATSVLTIDRFKKCD